MHTLKIIYEDVVSLGPVLGPTLDKNLEPPEWPGINAQLPLLHNSQLLYCSVMELSIGKHFTTHFQNTLKVKN